MSLQKQGIIRTLPVVMGICILVALIATPAYAEVHINKTVPGNLPVNLKISADGDSRTMMRSAAAPSAAGTTAAPDLLWKFGVFWDGDFYGKTAIPAVDGGYLLAGESRVNGDENSAQGAALVLNEPVNGNTSFRWAWLYGIDGTYDSFSDAVADSNGYVFAGGSKVFNPPATDAWLLHTDSGGYGDGSTYWQRTYPGAGSTVPDQFNAVVRSTDGGFALAGTTGSYHPDTVSNDAFLIRTDASGTTTGSGAYDGTVPKTAESIRQTTDGGYILAGSTTPPEAARPNSS